MTNDAEPSRLELAEDVARAWNRERIHYSVVHGLYRYPQSLGRDLDVLMFPEDARRAIQVALATGRANGYSRSLYRWSHWGLHQLSLINETTGASLPIDMMTTTYVWRAKWIRLMNMDQLRNFIGSSSQLGPFAVSDEATFLKAGVRSLLCGSLRYFEHEYPLPVDLERFSGRYDFLEVIGPVGARILGLESIDDLRRSYPRAMHAMQARWVARHPFDAARQAVGAAKGRVARVLRNSGDTIEIRTSRPNEALAALSSLREALRVKFVDLRVPERTPAGWSERKWGFFVRWRPRPVSEFIVTAIVSEVSPPREGPGTLVRVRHGKGRWLGSPDLVIEIHGFESVDDVRPILLESLMGFLYATYSFDEEGGRS